MSRPIPFICRNRIRTRSQQQSCSVCYKGYKSLAKQVQEVENEISNDVVMDEILNVLTMKYGNITVRLLDGEGSLTQFEESEFTLAATAFKTRTGNK